MGENEIAKNIIDGAYRIHRKLGPGLLESVCETLLTSELGKIGVTSKMQTAVTILCDGFS
jgi:GxxExxY protein